MIDKNFQRKNQKTNNQNGLQFANQNNSEFDQYQNYNENFEANQIFGNTFEQSKAETISTIPLYPENNTSTQSQNKTSNLNVED